MGWGGDNRKYFIRACNVLRWTNDDADANPTQLPAKRLNDGYQIVNSDGTAAALHTFPICFDCVGLLGWVGRSMFSGRGRHSHTTAEQIKS